MKLTDEDRAFAEFVDQYCSAGAKDSQWYRQIWHAAYGAGAEAMRERAAEVCDVIRDNSNGTTVGMACATVGFVCGERIRALEVGDE